MKALNLKVSHLNFPVAKQYRVHLQCRKWGFTSGAGKTPWRKEMETHSSILAWKIPLTRGTWWTTDHEVTKILTLLSD